MQDTRLSISVRALCAMPFEHMIMCTLHKSVQVSSKHTNNTLPAMMPFAAISAASLSLLIRTHTHINTHTPHTHTNNTRTHTQHTYLQRSPSPPSHPPLSCSPSCPSTPSTPPTPQVRPLLAPPHSTTLKAEASSTHLACWGALS